jgi:hypothetical protein
MLNDKRPAAIILTGSATAVLMLNEYTVRVGATQ